VLRPNQAPLTGLWTPWCPNFRDRVTGWAGMGVLQ
jgi:hypothetical protein